MIETSKAREGKESQNGKTYSLDKLVDVLLALEGSHPG